MNYVLVREVIIKLFKNPKVHVAMFLFFAVYCLANGISIFLQHLSAPVRIFGGMCLIGGLSGLQLAWLTYRKMKESGGVDSKQRGIIKNQLFLKKPWTVPVLTVAGAVLGLSYANETGRAFGFAANAAIFLGVVGVINILFFWALKRTRNQDPSKS